jgi:hypothetical protein
MAARLSVTRTTRQRPALGLAALIAIAVAGVIVLLATGGSGTGASRSGRSRADRAIARPISTPIAAGMATFTDPAARFAISYPASWTRLVSTDRQIPLLVAAPGHSEAMLVRVTHLGLAAGPITQGQLPALRPLTNRLVDADARVRLLQPPAEVRLGGLPGWAYAYTAANGAHGTRIGHVHYFLFAGGTLIALVFQVGDAGHLGAVAPALARIAASFRTVG